MDLASVDILQKQADAYASNGKIIEAIGLYEQIIQLEPNLVHVHEELGRLLDAQGWQELAMPHYANALAMAPKKYSLETHIDFGNLWLRRNQIDKAIISYKQVLELNPGYAPAYQAWANALIQENKLDAAAEVYSQAEFYDLDLISAKNYSDLGIAYMRQNQTDKAIGSFQKAISLQADYAPAHCNLGNALLQLENYKDAIISFQEALSLDPNFIEVYYNLGLALTKINRIDEAITCFEAVLALDPDFADAGFRLSNLSKKPNQKT